MPDVHPTRHRGSRVWTTDVGSWPEIGVLDVLCRPLWSLIPSTRLSSLAGLPGHFLAYTTRTENCVAYSGGGNPTPPSRDIVPQAVEWGRLRVSIYTEGAFSRSFGRSHLGLSGQLRGADYGSESRGHFFHSLRWQPVLRSRHNLRSGRQVSQGRERYGSSSRSGGASDSGSGSRGTSIGEKSFSRLWELADSPGTFVFAFFAPWRYCLGFKTRTTFVGGGDQRQNRSARHAARSPPLRLMVAWFANRDGCCRLSKLDSLHTARVGRHKSTYDTAH